MTWTYSGDPSASDLDEVRFLVGDTVSTRPLVTDEEINWALAEYSGTKLASAEICDAIAAKYSGRADSKVGDVMVRWSQVSAQYSKRAADLRKDSYTLAEPFFGGRTIDGKETLAEDTDAVQPSFAIGQDDIPGTQSSAGYYDPRKGY